MTQRQVNSQLWARDLVSAYDSRELRIVERDLIAEHACDFANRTLELGCGAGRLTGYLADCSQHLVGLDVSESMLSACKRSYPKVHTVLGDMADLSTFGDGEFGAVVAGSNVLDVFDHELRLRTLHEIHRIVAANGLLVLSSHNLGAASPKALRVHLLARGRRHLLSSLVRLPRWLANHRRRSKFEYRTEDHAVLNDVSHDYEALHYYVTRDAMAQQLESTGWELQSCRDLDGVEVPAGSTAEHCLELHFVARRR